MATSARGLAPAGNVEHLCSGSRSRSTGASVTVAETVSETARRRGKHGTSPTTADCTQRHVSLWQDISVTPTV